MTALIGFLREFTKELVAQADRLENSFGDDAAAGLAAVVTIRAIAASVESAMKRTLLA